MWVKWKMEPWRDFNEHIDWKTKDLLSRSPHKKNVTYSLGQRQISVGLAESTLTNKSVKKSTIHA